MIRKIAALVALGSLWLCNGCATLFTPANAFRKIVLSDDTWSDDVADLPSLQHALQNSLDYYNQRDEKDRISIGGDFYTIQELKASLQTTQDYLQANGLDKRFFVFLKEYYQFYVPSVSPQIVTAYCTPLLRGSYKPSTTYPQPIYRLPPDWVIINTKAFKKWDPDLPEAGLLVGRVTEDRRVVPYYSREEIDFNGALKDQNCELLWVENPAEQYFLQVEGSGIIELEDGTTTRVAYAGKNGYPCRLIGKILRDEKKLPEGQLTIENIKKYLHEHPEELRHILSYDPSYVFFSPAAGDFTTGCFEVPVVPFRSVATDRRLFPPGVLGYLETSMPIYDAQMNFQAEKQIHTLVLNQDTGGAIRGPGRLDWYTGSGPVAEALASRMKSEGRLYLLIKKPANPP